MTNPPMGQIHTTRNEYDNKYFVIDRINNQKQTHHLSLASDQQIGEVHSFINESVVSPKGGCTRLACRHILAIHFSSTMVV